MMNKKKKKNNNDKIMELQADKSVELIQRIKLLAGLNVIEKRKCQDGSFIYGNQS